jgi:hypothetical protein
LGFRLSLGKVNLAWRFKEITFTPGKVNLEWRKNCCEVWPAKPDLLSLPRKVNPGIEKSL